MASQMANAEITVPRSWAQSYQRFPGLSLKWTRTLFFMLRILQESSSVYVVHSAGYHPFIFIFFRLSRYSEGSRGTTDDFTTSFLHFFPPVIHCPLGLGELQTCPFPDVVFPPFLLSVLSSSPFHFQMVFARHDERGTSPYHFSLGLFTMVRRSSCGSIARWILARTSSFGNMVFVWSAQYLAITPHFYELYYSSQFCCEGPWFTVIFKVIVIRWLFRPDENICGWLGVHCQITNSFAVSRTYFLTMFSCSYGLLYRTIVSRWTLR